MSGQFGFQTTDPLPPCAWPSFDADDIEECGLPVLVKAWQRLSVTSRVILVDEDFDYGLIRDEDILP